jgi:hypothetical protein
MTKRLWGILIVTMTLTVLYGPFLVRHLRNAADPLLFNDDARQNIVPFVLPGYSSDYYLAHLPIGYKALLWSVGTFEDPIAVSRALPYLLLLVLLILIAVASARLGGLVAAACSVALCLSSSVFLYAMAGASPRAFGFPWLAMGAVALAYGRTWWLAATIIGATAFYQPVAVALGLTLGLHVLVLPARIRGDCQFWSFRRRLLVVAATAVCAFLVLAPGLTARGYGPLLTAADVAAYPEAGTSGRYGSIDRVVAPFVSPWTELRRTQYETLTGGGRPWSPWLRAVARRIGLVGELAVAGMMAGGLTIAAIREPAVARMAMMLVAALIAYTASRLVAPYLYAPERYLGYPLPIFIVIALPVAAGAIPLLSRHLSDRRWSRSVATLVITGACLLFFGSRGDDKVGFTVDMRDDAQVFEFLRSLPETSLLAGWPGPNTLIDSAPYLTQRRAFVTFETHQAFHREYVETMRRRMRALIDAMFATDSAPLRRLRDDWGVTHLITDRRYFDSPPPRYFQPFDGWANEAIQQGGSLGFEIPRLWEKAAVFSRGHVVIISLGEPGKGLIPLPPETRP